MKIYITYFYNIRFFEPHMIPVSTAVWDPKWFHEMKSQDIVYKDKNGVLNGIRFPELSPMKLDTHECPCDNRDAKECGFIKNYGAYLETLDFEQLMFRLEYIGNTAKNILGFKEDPEICLIVHEKPDNPCSERGPLIAYFKKNGIDLTEWSKPISKNNDSNN